MITEHWQIWLVWKYIDGLHHCWVFAKTKKVVINVQMFVKTSIKFMSIRKRYVESGYSETEALQQLRKIQKNMQDKQNVIEFRFGNIIVLPSSSWSVNYSLFRKDISRMPVPISHIPATIGKQQHWQSQKTKESTRSNNNYREKNDYKSNHTKFDK